MQTLSTQYLQSMIWGCLGSLSCSEFPLQDSSSQVRVRTAPTSFYDISHELHQNVLFTPTY